MKVLINLIENHEEWLTERICHYVGVHGYLKHTSLSKEEWRHSMSFLSTAVLTCLNGRNRIRESGPEDDYLEGPLAQFAALEAKRHQQWGGALGLFLCLLKFYRQSYLDLIHQAYLTPSEKNHGSFLINRLFDRLEIAGWVTWNNDGAPENGESEESVETDPWEKVSRSRYLEETHERLLSRYEGILNAAWEGIVELDLNGIVTFANPAAAAMLGYEFEELLGRHGHSTWHHTKPDGTPHEKEECGLHKAMQVGEVLHAQDCVFWRKDGTSFPVEYAGKPLVEDGKVAGAVLTFWDITARRQAEEALQDREERLQRLLETAPSGIAITDAQGNIIFANPEAEKILGLRRSDDTQTAYQDSGWRFTRLDGQPLHRDEFPCDLVLRTGTTVYNLEYAVVLPDGTRSLLSVNAAPLRNGGEKIIGVVVSLNNVTARLQADEALKESEAKYRELVENANSIILRLDPQGGITFFNEFAQQFFGFSEKEILGQDAMGTIVPETDSTGNDLRAKILDLAQHPELYQSTDNENMRRNGERVWVSWTNKAIRDHSGEIKGILCIGNDITKLRQAEESFKNLVNNAPIGIFIVQKGRFTLLNAAFPKITGYSEAELLGKDALCLVAPEFKQQVRDQTLKMVRGERTSPYEFQIITKDGKRKWIMESVSPTRYAGEKAVLGYCIDITDHKEIADQLLQAQKMEAVGRLAGGVAHDFNNMLGVILGYAEIALIQLSEQDPIHKNLEEMKSAAERAATLVRQLLAFSRKQILEPRVIDLNALVTDFKRMLQRLIGEDIDLKLALEPEVAAVKADPGQMEQVIMNLAINAKDAMPQGGKLTIETHNVYLDEIYAQSHADVTPGPYVMLTVSDNGEGINPEILSYLFEPFYTTKEAGKGTGLGLSTAYGIVKQNGGNIEVYSQLGWGTTFKIYLPQVAEDVQPKEIPLTTPPPGGSETVLVVEDEDMLRALIVEVLEKYGYQVLAAPNGAEALLLGERLQEQIHLLLTDVVMPQMSGRELAAQLRTLHPEIKVLYMSGYTADAITQHGVLEDRTSFIQKPFRLLSMASKVREILDGPGELPAKAEL